MIDVSKLTDAELKSEIKRICMLPEGDCHPDDVILHDAIVLEKRKRDEKSLQNQAFARWR